MLKLSSSNSGAALSTVTTLIIGVCFPAISFAVIVNVYVPSGSSPEVKFFSQLYQSPLSAVRSSRFIVILISSVSSSSETPGELIVTAAVLSRAFVSFTRPENVKPLFTVFPETPTRVSSIEGYALST